MRKFVEFEIHEFMDEHPESSFRAMEESEAQNFADHMNKCYSGGTTRFVRVLTKEEATMHVLNEIKKVLEKPTVCRKDGSLDTIDVEFIDTLIKEFEKCYK